jgi:hypothetical protein
VVLKESDDLMRSLFFSIVKAGLCKSNPDDP